MKKIFLLILISFSFYLVSCDTNKDDPCANGHDWKEATFTEPKTCLNCGETSGEILTQDKKMLSNAFEKLNEGNFTMNMHQTESGQLYPKYTMKLYCETNKILILDDAYNTSYLKYKIYAEENNNFVNLWSYKPEIGSWSSPTKISIREFFDKQSLNPLEGMDSDAFELRNGFWYGDIEIIEKVFNVYIHELSPESNIDFEKFTVTLNIDGNIKNVRLVLTVTTPTNTYPINTKLIINYEFSNIGSTVVEKPYGLK